jgi:hypothetical protein
MLTTTRWSALLGRYVDTRARGHALPSGIVALAIVQMAGLGVRTSQQQWGRDGLGKELESKMVAGYAREECWLQFHYMSTYQLNRQNHPIPLFLSTPHAHHPLGCIRRPTSRVLLRNTGLANRNIPLHLILHRDRVPHEIAQCSVPRRLRYCSKARRSRAGTD